MNKAKMQFDKYHSDYLSEMLYNMMKSSKLTDVTLVCDGKTQINAHKNVLSASSEVFKHIVDNLHQSNSVIYLRGIQKQEMESIVEFMYLGQATLSSERMDEFFHVAKILEIKGIDELKKEKIESTSGDKDLGTEILETQGGGTKEVKDLKKEKIESPENKIEQQLLNDNKLYPDNNDNGHGKNTC